MKPKVPTQIGDLEATVVAKKTAWLILLIFLLTK